MNYRRFSVSGLAVVLSAVLMALLAGCEPSAPKLLPKEKLFSISLGTLEDEMDLFVRDGKTSNEKNRMVYFDGLVFVSNGNSRKVMEYSSYGDLITLHYNPDLNPQPVILGLTNSESQLKNRQAVPYNFNSVGEIAVSKNKILLVEDRVTQERRSYDDKRQALLDRVVLRFGAAGKFLDYLGQEGVGGTPFPYIEKLAVNQRDEIIVICRTVNTWLAYYFSIDGKPLYQVAIDYNQLPIPEGKQREAIFASLESIYPDWENHTLYLKISYFEKSIDQTTRTDSGILVAQSRVVFFNVEKQSFEGGFEIPRLVRPVANPAPGEPTTAEFPYDFLGPSQGERFFFLSASDNGNHRLSILDKQGKVQFENNVYLDEENLLFSQFYVTAKGALTGMVSDGKAVDISWWRSDKLIFPYAQTPF